MLKTYSEIIKDKLFVGSHTALKNMRRKGYLVDQWLACAEECNPVDRGGAHIHWCWLRDAPLTISQIKKAESFSDLAVELLESKNQLVLITCHVGINRSALVAALTLMKLGVADPIELLRRKRDPHVLSNSSFVAYIKKREADLL